MGCSPKESKRACPTDTSLPGRIADRARAARAAPVPSPHVRMSEVGKAKGLEPEKWTDVRARMFDGGQPACLSKTFQFHTRVPLLHHLHIVMSLVLALSSE